MIALSVDRTVWLNHDAPSPTVYLDHGPLLEISKQHHADRFVAALKKRSSTLVFSWLNAVELVDPEDPKTFARADQLFVKAFPNVAFLEVIPDLVIHEEDLDNGGPRISRPQLDGKLLRQYGLWASEQGKLDVVDPEGFLQFFRSHRDALKQMWQVSCDRVLKALEFGRKSGGYPRADLSKAAKTARPTRYFDSLALHYLVNSNTSLTSQNVRDYHHTVVPISYCDYVVLDKQWAEMAGQFQRQLQAVDLLRHEARVFRVGDLEGFLTAFETDDYLIPLR